jgi:hypothetical protein
VIELLCSTDAAKTRKQLQRARLPSLLVFGLSLANCLVFLFFAGVFFSPSTRAQTSGLDSIEVVLFDPLSKSGTEDGFRPVTARVTLPNGALASRDQDFWIVQRLTASYSRNRVQKVLHKKFTLKEGANQVDVSFPAQCTGEHFQSQELFIERDGNLSFAPQSNLDFCQSVRTLNWNNRLEGCFNVLMIRGSGGLCMKSSSATIIDFRELPGRHEATLYTPGVTAVLYPASLLALDKVVWETVSMRFNWLRGFDGAFNGGSKDLTYSSSEEFIRTNRWFSVGTPEQMPDDWAALINLDLLLISEQDLAKLADTKLSAVQLWLAAGGRLVLTDCSVDKSGLRGIFEKLIGPRETLERRLRDPSCMLIAEQDHNGELSEHFEDIAPNGLLMAKQPSSIECISLNRCPTRAVDDDTEIGQRDILFFDQVVGRVACTALKVDDFQPADWRRMLLATYGNGKSENVRSTLGRRTLAGGQLENFEVTGVSQPPKLLFLGLITLFAIVAGPLAYTVLYRSRRVNFLLAVVPLISLLTTLGLFLYVVLADGFQFQTRRLSFSRLDQNTQQAITMTRHAVFSGTSPRSYAAERNQLFLPAYPEDRDLQQVQFSDKESRLTANWIRARMPHQVTTASVQAVTAGLDVNHKKNTNGEVTVSVTNRLGGPLVGALLKIDNEWYEVGALGVGETAATTVSTLFDFESRIRPVFQKALNPAPDNWVNSTVPFDESQDESALVALLKRLDLVGNDLIQNGQYLAVLEDYPGASQLKDYAKYQHQLHLIHGNW